MGKSKIIINWVIPTLVGLVSLLFPFVNNDVSELNPFDFVVGFLGVKIVLGFFKRAENEEKMEKALTELESEAESLEDVEMLGKINDITYYAKICGWVSTMGIFGGAFFLLSDTITIIVYILIAFVSTLPLILIYTYFIMFRNKLEKNMGDE